MNFGSLLAALGVATVKSEVQAAAQRFGRRAAFGALTGILALTALGLALAALTVWLSDELGVIAALLIVAAGLLVVAAIAWVIGASMDRRPSRPARRRPAYRAAPIADVPPEAPIGEDAPPAGSEIGAMAIVGVLGFLLARQFFRRR